MQSSDELGVFNYLYLHLIFALICRINFASFSRNANFDGVLTSCHGFASTTDGFTPGATASDHNYWSKH